jgi:hypothetical protein
LTWPVYQNIYVKLYEDYEIRGELKIVKGLKWYNCSKLIIKKYRELSAKTYDFLLSRNLLTLPATKPKTLAILSREISFE